MPTTSGELRETLIEAIHAIRNGDLDYEDAKAMALLAHQVNLSLQVETNIRREEVALGRNGNVALIGHLPLGEPKAVTPPVIAHASPPDAAAAPESGKVEQ